MDYLYLNPSPLDLTVFFTICSSSQNQIIHKYSNKLFIYIQVFNQRLHQTQYYNRIQIELKNTTQRKPVKRTWIVQFNMDEQIHKGTTWRTILASLLFSNGTPPNKEKGRATLLLDWNQSNGRVRLKVLSCVLIWRRKEMAQHSTLFLYIFSTFLSLYRPIFVLDSKTSTLFSCLSFCSSTKISMQHLQDSNLNFFFCWIFEPVVKVIKCSKKAL